MTKSKLVDDPYFNYLSSFSFFGDDPYFNYRRDISASLSITQLVKILYHRPKD